MYQIVVIYFIIYSTVFVYASVDLKDFYPFGELNGDTVLPRGENQCGSVNMKIPLCESSLIYTEVYISTNGILSNTKALCSFTNGISPYSQCYRQFLTSRLNAFAPFFTLTASSIFGTVQFRETYDVDVLHRINRDIIDFGLFNYNSTNALIVTWIDMTFAAYNGDVNSTPKNSFQAVLTSDGYYTFVIFYYNKITWNQGDYTAPCTGDTNTGIGINCTAQAVFASPVLMQEAGNLLSNHSNVNRPGIWIVRTDCANPKRVTSIKPADLDMMGHRSLNFIIPDSLNCSTEWKFAWYNFNSNCHIISASHDVTELTCFPTFAPYYGSAYAENKPLYLQCDSQAEPLAYTFSFEAFMFLTPPVPEVSIKVLNVSVVDYSVNIELSWTAPLIAELNPGCETVNISMHIFNPNTRIWNDYILIMQSVNNSGGLDINLVEPIAGLFFSKHLLIGVTGNVGSYVSNQNTIFSKMFIFDPANFNLKRKVKSLRDENVLGTVDMMGHSKLNISYRTKPGQDGLVCQFIDYSNKPVTQAMASSNNQFVTCYVPFLYSYGYINVYLVTGSLSTKTASNDYQFQRMGANKKQPNMHKTRTKFIDNLLNFVIDVLPSYPRLAVEQVSTPKESNGQFQVQMQFTWDPSEIPSEYPVLNAFIYQFDEEQNQWMKELMVSPQYIQPNAGSVPLTLSQDAIGIFFNHKVMFGLGYVQGDENFVIFSKMYIPGEST